MNSRKHFDPIEPPPRWLNCPRKANTLIDKFIAFKVPLSQKFNPNVPLECRFHMSMLLDSVKKNFGAKIGLIIDLTNTNRFYDADKEVKQMGIKYFKLRCKGHGETPSEDNKDLFLNLVETFVRTNPTELIGVHCTHGFNRTGFLICCYLVEKLDYSVDMAISLFAQARPPGIYKQEYLDKIYNTYVKDEETRSMIQIPIAPSLPTWEEEPTKSTTNAEVASSVNNSEKNAAADDNDGDDDDDGGDDDDGENLSSESSQGGKASSSNNSTAKRPKSSSRNPTKRKRTDQESNKLNAKFADPDLEGVETCTDPDEIDRVRNETKKICGWNGAGFPGAQPVSMDQQNIRFLIEKKYQVSWKADGTRYLMYINGPNKTYFIDRDNSVFIARNLTFLHRKTSRHLESTLLDGVDDFKLEFVLDVDPTTNKKIPRFLIYDIVKFETDDVGKVNFAIRMECIEKEIIQARQEAMRLGKINRQTEPLSIRKKQFYPISDSKKLLSEEFNKQLTHGIDGLIYQPVDEFYRAGRCDTMLKWKPPSMNSVDFRLQIIVKEEYGALPEKIGCLFVLGYDEPFSNIKITKSIANLNNKIIECRWVENRWEFMRERLDKSYPNHYTTAMAVCGSIRNPITQEKLLEIIQQVENDRRKLSAAASVMGPPLMPPPLLPPPQAHSASVEKK